MPMPEIYLKFLHVIHHLKQSSYQCFHFSMKLSRLQRNKSILCVLSLIKCKNFSIQFFVFFSKFVPVFFLDPKKFQHCLSWHFKPKKLFGIFLLVIPSRHLQAKTLIIYLRHPCILQKLTKTLLYFEYIGLSLQKPPLCKLQADLFKIDVAELIYQSQDSIEVLKSYIVDMSSMEPKTLDAFLRVLDDIIANPLKKLILWHVEATQIYLQHLYMFAGGQNSSDVAEEVVENLLFGEMPVTETLQFNV